jgi:hypothetical protein
VVVAVAAAVVGQWETDDGAHGDVEKDAAMLLRLGPGLSLGPDRSASARRAAAIDWEAGGDLPNRQFLGGKEGVGDCPSRRVTDCYCRCGVVVVDGGGAVDENNVEPEQEGPVFLDRIRLQA